MLIKPRPSQLLGIESSSHSIKSFQSTLYFQKKEIKTQTNMSINYPTKIM